MSQEDWCMCLVVTCTPTYSHATWGIRVAGCLLLQVKQNQNAGLWFTGSPGARNKTPLKQPNSPALKMLFQSPSASPAQHNLDSPLVKAAGLPGIFDSPPEGEEGAAQQQVVAHVVQHLQGGAEAPSLQEQQEEEQQEEERELKVSDTWFIGQAEPMPKASMGPWG